MMDMTVLARGVSCCTEVGARLLTAELGRRVGGSREATLTQRVSGRRVRDPF